MSTQNKLKSNALKEAFVFFAITLGLVYFVLWEPLVLLQIPASSFVSKVRGPAWTLGLLFLGGFTPSLVALAMTGCNEGRAGLKQMWQRAIHFKIGWRWLRLERLAKSCSFTLLEEHLISRFS